MLAEEESRDVDSPLAIDGGPATFPEGAPKWPAPDEMVAVALRALLDDGSWGRYEGPHGARLVELLCSLHDVPFAYPCCSGTCAVELALRGLKVGPRDEVILAGYDFPGNFRCIEAVGSRPVLADIDPQTWCLDVSRLEEVISRNTGAVIVSHLHGGLANMPDLMDLAARHGIAVVEDACQAPGAKIHGRRAGTWGDVGILSFGGSKLLTAGRGGALLTHREEVLQRVKVFAERGNMAFPLSELQAAVLAPQLRQLDSRNQQRRDQVHRLMQHLEKVPGLVAGGCQQAACEPSYYKVAWSYQSDACHGRPRDEFIAAIQAEGVAIDVGFRGFLRRGPQRCRKPHSLQNCEEASCATVLLHHPVLLETATTIDRVAAALQKVLRKLSR